MKDWTDIIGEELENIEEPLPADDWSVLQQKYAASQKRKRAAAFAWAGGFTSVAAAIALVLLLVSPDEYERCPIESGMTSTVIPGTSPVTPDQTTVIPDLSTVVHDQTPVIPDLIGNLNGHVAETPADAISSIVPFTQKKSTAPVSATAKAIEDVLIAENSTEGTSPKQNEETFDVIRDTTSSYERLLADASATTKDEDEHTEPTGTSGFEDFPEDEQVRKRRPISIGISGAASDSPSIGIYDNIYHDPLDQEPPYVSNPDPKDSLTTVNPQQSMSMMRSKSGYSDSYRHEVPVSIGVSARIHLTDRLSVNTGLNYTWYTSTRNRIFIGTSKYQNDKQNVHYLGIPVRLDYMAVNKKHFNFYFGAGMQMDKCIYATVGNERLHEKQVLFGVNGTMGLQVNIVPMVGLYFEPEVYYALNEGSIETFRSDEPFAITLRGGLRLNF